MKPDQTVDQDRMGRALMAEMKTILNLSGFQRVRSVFFGGGTPSMMKPDIIQNILKHLNSQYGFDPSHSELTIEANPNDVSANVMSWASMGFNRISLGLQSLAEDDLKLLNRDHNPQQGLNALELCLKHVPSGTTCDLMFGRPGQTLQSWQQELNRILEYPLKHISLYELTVERGTPLWKDVQAGTLQMPNGDTMAAMYEEAIERLADCDLERYEVSNFAKLGFESVHNSAYWHGGEYIGIGPGAHGRFCIRNNQHSAKDVRACDWIRGNPISTTKKFQTSNWQARIQTLEPDHWMREVELAGHGTRKIQALSLPDYFESVLMSSLRTKSGMNGDWLKNMSFTFPDLVSNFGATYEVRDFPARKWASTYNMGMEIHGSEEFSESFHRLFDYIDGQNAEGLTIDMTTPVTTYIIPGAGPNCESEFTMSFYIPAIHQEAPIQPAADNVYIEEREAFTVVATQFSGFATSNDFIKAASELYQAATADGLNVFADTYYTVSYDGPYTLVDRRNEVWFKLRD
eukprot:snap_masked-scaffold184_size276635-processed-gene-1.13 protein:Tk08114 transcript:snap_masked-scaffold184_size276635-processed-gene-1.13-mRNA-1 annotation:"radical s-adenosyl methionine domain-containing protein mitochondrial-like"